MPKLAIAPEAVNSAVANEVLEARALLSQANTGFGKANDIVAEHGGSFGVRPAVANYSAHLIFGACNDIEAFVRTYKKSPGYQAKVRGDDEINCAILADIDVQTYLSEVAREVEKCFALGIAGEDLATELRRLRDSGRPTYIEDVLAACGAAEGCLRAKLAKGAR